MIKANTVNQPTPVRPCEESSYKIVAGHRQRASELVRYSNMPCIVRNMTDDEAIHAMTDDNLRHREKILPTEKAQSLKMQVKAIKHQGGPGLGEAAGKRSTEIVGARKLEPILSLSDSGGSLSPVCLGPETQEDNKAHDMTPQGCLFCAHLRSVRPWDGLCQQCHGETLLLGG